MKILFKCLFGSRLYGTQKPESDYDYKAVYNVSYDEYLAKRGNLNTTNTVTADPHGVKVETECFHVQEFARLLNQNQTIAMSMLFCPREHWLESSPQWEELVANRDRIVSRNIMPYIGYARSQAVKYSLKGDRLGTLEAFISHVKVCMTKYGPLELPTEAFEKMCESFEGREGVRIWVDVKGGVETKLIEVCGKSFGATTALKLSEPPLRSLWEQYGQRARTAMETNGRDLKAMYHAVRIVSEASEILNTGFVTYPRPEVDLLMRVRNGEMSNGEVQDLLETLIAQMNLDLETSTLQDRPDAVWLSEWAIKSMKQDWRPNLWGRVKNLWRQP
jgi:hypothetical protein